MSRSRETLRTRPYPRDDVIQLAIRLGLLAFLVYWSYVLVRPFVPILIWSTVLATAMYPGFAWLADRLHGRRYLAAMVVTSLGLAFLIGPAAWLGFGLIDSLGALSDLLGAGALTVPPPPASVKSWPLIGAWIHEAWDMAATNLGSALRQLAPQLKPFAGPVLGAARRAAAGIFYILASIVVAGFLLPPGPRLAQAARAMLLHIVPQRSDEFVALAGATIRSVTRGIIGIALLQALVVGIGFKVAGVPGASVLTVMVLALGIVQIGAAIVIIPVVAWCWSWMDHQSAALFTAYMIPASLLDNVLKPIVMGQGLKTPTLVVVIGVIGGTLAHGLIGLFVGPIVLAVAWELLVAWMRADDPAAGAADAPRACVEDDRGAA
ncbi:MAG: AI-2E family transporter [Pseudomonadota bacterium]